MERKSSLAVYAIAAVVVLGLLAGICAACRAGVRELGPRARAEATIAVMQARATLEAEEAARRMREAAERAEVQRDVATRHATGRAITVALAVLGLAAGLAVVAFIWSVAIRHARATVELQPERRLPARSPALLPDVVFIPPALGGGVLRLDELQPCDPALIRACGDADAMRRVAVAGPAFAAAQLQAGRERGE